MLKKVKYYLIICMFCVIMCNKRHMLVFSFTKSFLLLNFSFTITMGISEGESLYGDFTFIKNAIGLV